MRVMLCTLLLAAGAAVWTAGAPPVTAAVVCGPPEVGSTDVAVSGSGAAVCDPNTGSAAVGASADSSGATVYYSSCTRGGACNNSTVADVDTSGSSVGTVSVSLGGDANGYPLCSRFAVDLGCLYGADVAVTPTGDARGGVAVSGTGDADGAVAVTGTGEPDGLVYASSDSAGVDGPGMPETTGAIVVAIKTLLPRCSHLMYLTGLGPECPSWYPGYPSSGTNEDGYECENCVAFNGMEWQTKSGGERVRFFNNRNQSTEVIDEQENHGALIRSDKGKCGSSVYDDAVSIRNAYSGKVQGWASGPELTSTFADGTHDTWVATSGHVWRDGGSEWPVNTVTDICKNF